MLIFNEENKPIILNSIQGPVLSEYFYVLNFQMMDYHLAPLLVFEEIICPTIVLNIRGFTFNLPANWNILVCDEETMQLDVVEISELAGKEFKALIYGMSMKMVEMERIIVMDYYPDYRNISPSLNKYQMLCHPISASTWINVAPSDSYNKFLKGKVAGDII